MTGVHIPLLNEFYLLSPKRLEAGTLNCSITTKFSVPDAVTGHTQVELRLATSQSAVRALCTQLTPRPGCDPALTLTCQTNPHPGSLSHCTVGSSVRAAQPSASDYSGQHVSFPASTEKNGRSSNSQETLSLAVQRSHRDSQGPCHSLLSLACLTLRSFP